MMNEQEFVDSLREVVDRLMSERDQLKKELGATREKFDVVRHALTAAFRLLVYLEENQSCKESAKT